MAGGMDLGGGGKGGKKSLDAALNLVPFIDLMAVTIVFLIMSAVWTQLGRLQVSSSGTSGDPVDVPVLEPITLLITEKELKLTVGSSVLDPLPVTYTANGDLEVDRLLVKLRELHAQQPDQSAITLSSEDTVKYRDLVHLLDTVVKDGQTPLFPSVTVSAASGTW